LYVLVVNVKNVAHCLLQLTLFHVAYIECISLKWKAKKVQERGEEDGESCFKRKDKGIKGLERRILQTAVLELC